MKFGLILMLVLTSTTISCCYDIQEEVVEAGKNVTLKCVNVSANISQLEWTRPDLAKNKYVFFYRNNKVDEGAIDPRFQGRVTLKDPTADIVLENVTVNDTGTYECYVDIQRQKRAADGVDHNPPDRVIKLIVTDGKHGLFEWIRSPVGIVVVATGLVFVAVVAGVLVFLVVRRWRQRERKEEVVKPGEDVPLTTMPQETSTSQLEHATSYFDGKSVFLYRDNKVNERVIDQRFNGRVTLKDPQTADIILERVTVNDTGIYQCVVNGENQHQNGDVNPHRVFNLTVTDDIQEVKAVEEAEPGDDVTLKGVSVSGEINQLKWTRDGLADDKCVFFYQDNKVDEGDIDPRFQGRVTRKGPQTADIVLENVTVSDTGIYKCLVHLENNQHQNGAAVGVDDPPHGVVNLIVTDGEFPDFKTPHLTVKDPGHKVQDL